MSTQFSSIVLRRLWLGLGLCAALVGLLVGEAQVTAQAANLTPKIFDYYGSIFLYEALNPAHNTHDIYGMTRSDVVVPLTNHPADDLAPRLSPDSLYILFSSNRGGSYDLYRMNQDQSNLVQLTSLPGDELNAVWSPDGGQIAFEAGSGDNKDIYLMQADGSGIRNLGLNSSGYDGYPVWSPDGSQLAFLSSPNSNTTKRALYVYQFNSGQVRLLNNTLDIARPLWLLDSARIIFSANLDSDPFLETGIISAAGGEPRRFDYGGGCMYNENYYYYNCDFYPLRIIPSHRWVTGLFVVYKPVPGANTYETFIVAGTRYLGENSIDGARGLVRDVTNFDWGPIDVLPPLSSMMPLPPASPVKIELKWDAVERGYAGGSMRFDLEYRKNGGNWFLIQNYYGLKQYTFDSYGQAGDVFEFRVRASDSLGNREPWPEQPQAATVIESDPPRVRMNLTGYYQSAWSGDYSWQAEDPSGLARHALQYRRDGQSQWSDAGEQTGSGETSEELSMIFEGEPGRKYFLRAMAKDRAGNVGYSDEVAIYLYGAVISGRVQDNRGVPLPGLTPRLATTTLVELATDADGVFTSYLPQSSGVTSLTWPQPQFSPIPAVALSYPLQDDYVSFLAPADEIIQNGHFEQGLDGWQTAADLPLALSANGHSGQQALRLGRDQEVLADLVGQTAGTLTPLGWVFDSQGTLFAFWRAPDGLWSAKRQGEGWSAAQKLANLSDGLGSFQAIAAADGGLEIAWSAGVRIYQLRHAAGQWQSLTWLTLAGNAAASPFALIPRADDSQALLAATSQGFYFYQRAAQAEWSAGQLMPGPQTLGLAPHLVEDPDGRLHALYGASGSLWYNQMNSQGVWLEKPETLLPVLYYGGPTALAVAPDGSVHLFASLSISNRNLPLAPNGRVINHELYYNQRTEAGWQNAAPGLRLGWVDRNITAKFDQAGALHLLWRTADNRLAWQQQTAGVWQPLEFLATPPSLLDVSTSLLPDGSLYLLWSEYRQGRPALSQATISAAGEWQMLARPEAVAPAYPWIAVSEQGEVALGWLETGSDNQRWYGLPADKTRPLISNLRLSQVVTIPAEMNAPTLSFLYHNVAERQGLHFQLQTSDQVSQTIWQQPEDSLPEWRHAWVDLSDWAGQTVTLSLHLTQTTASIGQYLVVDEISLAPAFPELGLSLAGAPGVVTPGQVFEARLNYRNRGQTPAANGWISLTLPAELELLDSICPTLIDGPTLRLDLGDLAADMETQTCRLTLRVHPEVQPGSTLQLIATLDSETGDLAPVNNRISAVLRVEQRVYLPLLKR